MRVLIVDDEPLARQRLRDLLSDSGDSDIDIVGECSNGRDACTEAQQLNADVVLMDISMPLLDGLEAAQHLAQLDSPPAVVFCTAFDEHALAAFDAGAVDYLVKPIRRERLHEALQRARRYSGERIAGLRESSGRARSHLCARIRGTLRLIPIDSVLFLRAEEKYVVVRHKGGEDLVEDSLKTLEIEFGQRFLRIHRNCLIARGSLQELRRDAEGRVHAVLRDTDEELEISRRCLPVLRAAVRGGTP